MRVTATLIAALCLSSPAIVLAKNEPGERMICKYSHETGTRFRTKTCKTAAQWEEMAENNRANLKEMVDRPQIEIRK
ncbi:hypothetical protein [Sphingorhabdus sp.]|uniref:hypothetical protein n=1 Tax=Sphingorhabdus sp. TaxID=1902408 RepID=UPI0032B727D3